jgi:hypothetical protein
MPSIAKMVALMATQARRESPSRADEHTATKSLPV